MEEMEDSFSNEPSSPSSPATNIMKQLNTAVGGVQDYLHKSAEEIRKYTEAIKKRRKKRVSFTGLKPEENVKTKDDTESEDNTLMDLMDSLNRFELKIRIFQEEKEKYDAIVYSMRDRGCCPESVLTMDEIRRKYTVSEGTGV